MNNILVNVYWICLLMGFIWLAIQVFLADFGHDFGGSTFDMGGGHDVDVGGIGHDLHTGGAGSDVHMPSGEIHMSPVSPMVIAGFITTFGATGAVLTGATILYKGYILGISFSSGFVGGFIIWFILSRLIRAVSGTSEARIAELIGIEAEVITPIRGGSVGEIAYVAGGSRYTAPARNIDNASIERNHIVRIVRITGTTYFVKELTHEELHKTHN